MPLPLEYPLKGSYKSNATTPSSDITADGSPSAHQPVFSDISSGIPSEREPHEQHWSAQY